MGQVVKELEESLRKYERMAGLVNVEHLKRWILACKMGTNG
jgi:hypothetical protein